MSDIMHQMPSQIENGMMIPTLDRQGWIWLYKDEITESYIGFGSATNGLMLEIGAGYGHIVLDVLKKGARVIAVDVSQEQLEIIKSRAAAGGLSGLEVIRAEFPEELDLPAESINGVLISRLFHFFSGEIIRESLKKVRSWLRSGGKVLLSWIRFTGQSLKSLFHDTKKTSPMAWNGRAGWRMSASLSRRAGSIPIHSLWQ